MKLAGFTEESIVDGPGVRIVFFFQGCVHHCPFCQNPTTWSFDNGTEISLKQIEKLLDKKYKETSGVTLSGGDPFCNLKDAISLAKLIKEKYHLNLIAFTGYTLEEILILSEKNKDYLTLLSYLDTLIDGRFIMALRSIDINTRGSRNQRCIDMKKTIENNYQIVLASEMMDMSFYNNKYESF